MTKIHYRIKEAERVLLLGIENKAVPLKRLERAHVQFTTNHSIKFNKQEYTLEHYETITDISGTQFQEHVDEEELLLYSCHEDFPEEDKPILTQLNWLNAQLEHNARASILREVYYQNEETSLEELRVKYNPTRNTIQKFRKWKWQEPELQKMAPEQVQKTPRKSVDVPPECLLDLQPTRQEVKWLPEFTNEQIFDPQPNRQEVKKPPRLMTGHTFDVKPTQQELKKLPELMSEQIFDVKSIQKVKKPPGLITGNVFDMKPIKQEVKKRPALMNEHIYDVKLIQNVKRRPRLIKEQMFNLQPAQQKVKKVSKLMKGQVSKQQQLIGQAHQPSLIQQKSIKQQPTIKVQSTGELTAVIKIEASNTIQATKPITTMQENVVELPHSPDFVQAQINTSGARNCSTYHIIKDIAANIQKSLSSWFVYDKKKKLWKPSAKKEKKSVIKFLKNEFLVIEKIGEGGMAQVYLVQGTSNLAFYGLKVQQPPNPWEFYIHHQIDQRKKQNKITFRLLPIINYYYFVDTSFLLMPYIRHGTLLDAYNKYIEAQKVMPEPMVAFFTSQIMQQVSLLHSLDISHNDLKLDNVMLISKNENAVPNVILIDFGHSIDIRALEYNKCKANWPPPCSRSQYPLLNIAYVPTFADYWEIAAMAHRLLYGEPMQTQITHDGKYTIKQNIKRYWHVDLWSKSFDFFLNQPNEQTNMNNLLQEFEKLQVPDKLIYECIQVMYH
ncbi:unnamed protein product [Rhizopus stolonifer]